MTQNWTCTLTVKSILYTYTKYLYLWGPNFGPFRLMTSGFQDTMSPKIGNAPNDPPNQLEPLTLKSTLYTLNTYSWGPKFGPFRSTINRFRNTTACLRSPKSENALNDPNWTWTLNSKSTLFVHQILNPEAQIFIRFALWSAVSEIQGCQKSEMHRMTPNWTWTLMRQSQIMQASYGSMVYGFHTGFKEIVRLCGLRHMRSQIARCPYGIL